MRAGERRHGGMRRRRMEGRAMIAPPLPLSCGAHRRSRPAPGDSHDPPHAPLPAMTPDADDLLLFARVAESGSFSRA
ncbi:MAG: hypothetical protein M3N82_05360, partial [Pseudomonadota bacterium]|nr:hypothetical protein [Pseudomonadota bacterium]